jgi:hypothetical protein
MGNGPGKKPKVRIPVVRSRRSEAEGTPVRHTDGVKVSQRCRATHDVPYTLRCVLEASHMWTWNMPVNTPEGVMAAVLMHQDSKGGRW